MKQIGRFLSTTFIRLFLEQWKFIVVAMLLFTLGALGSFFAVLNDPQTMYAILPAEIAQGVNPEQLGSADGQVNSVDNVCQYHDK